MAAIILPGDALRRNTRQESRTAYFPLLLTSDRALQHNPLSSLPLPAAMPLIDHIGARPLLDEIAEMSPNYRKRQPHDRLRANMICMELLYNTLGGGFASGVLPQKWNATPDWVICCRELLKDSFADPDISIG